MINVAVLADDDGALLAQFLAQVAASSGDRLLIVLVVTSKRAARAQDLAEANGITTLFHPMDWYEATGRDPDAYYADLVAHLHAAGVQRVFLSGWSLPLSPHLSTAFPGQVASLEAYLATHDTHPIT
jgi:folate-dependent phosphoribosylglycinamide formyltransferase PurN